MNEPSPAIQLSIERIILDGITLNPHERDQFQVALQTELTRLVTERGLSPELRAGKTLASLPAPPIQLDTTSTSSQPVTLGHQVARSIYEGIGDETNR
jgi:hypothetical protein